MVILETDNVALVNLLSSDAGGRSTIAGLWQEIQELGRSLLFFKILHVRREANVAAHCCAQMPTPERCSYL
ncbi:hypothetical protein BAE44_0025639 [Dichanthelium oligosanthes]|uniref:RNase H type-1 domain-containing protein n=1 Tax=Dichanthelium oligosanthes TaxID=888268 RepID=A0A1E5UKE0_9POAL|nr:hypothetical protein BAE44_0025639 [Dichanthelium oligosanthes]